jgi:diguanylate cyclase (GGDEF)-like protein
MKVTELFHRQSGQGKPWKLFDMGVFSLVVALWGAFALRFAIPGWDGFWMGFTLFLLVASGAFSVRLWSPAVLLTLFSQRIFFVLLRDQPVASALAELGLQVAAMGVLPLGRRLFEQRKAETRREHLAIREGLAVKYAEGEEGRKKPEPDLDPEEALDRSEKGAHSIVMLLKQALACHSALFCWYDEAEKRLTVGSFSSDSPDAVTDEPFQLDKSPFKALESASSPLLLRCREDGTVRLPYYKTDSVAREIKVVLALPVMMRRKLLGIFVLDRTESQPFYAHDTGLAERAVRLLSESAELSKQLIQANRTISQLSSLNDAAALLGRARSFEEVYRVLVSSAVRLSSYRHAVLSHRTEDEAVYEVVAVTDKALGDSLGRQHGPGDGLAGLAIKADGPFPPPQSSFVPSVKNAFNEAVGMVLNSAESFLMIPMSSRGKPMAFLYVYGGPGADRSQLEVLRLLGNLGAGALGNAEANHSLKRLATTDVLTVLPNQRAFRVRLAEVWARYERRKDAFSLLFLDIDHFKRINDTYGHPVGDEVLRLVSAELTKMLRKVDLAARYGGEEFAMILEGTGREGAMIIADRIRLAVAKMDLSHMNISTKVTVSIGIATVPDDTDKLEKLIEIADEALYRAKSLGRNRCSFRS